MAFDLIRRLPQRALIALVHGYRLALKPWLGGACRFEPTCSAYALDALNRHGAARGSALAAWRLLRCHPGCAGGHDPVPEVWRLGRAPNGWHPRSAGPDYSNRTDR